ADVWALSSYTENFGIAVVEALACGLPSVISPAVNLAPEIERERAAVVAELRPEAFAEAIGDLLTDEGRRQELATAARAFAKGYDWPEIAPRLCELYRAVAAGGP
nr:glycosyltransferase [Actinomycetota bacterium]